MKKVTCDICHAVNIPVNSTLKVDGCIYCESCLNIHFPNEVAIKGRKIEKQLDPTICSKCNKDFGNRILNKISIYPVCTECEEEIKNKTMPGWVKAFFIGILAIVVFSCIWNWRFIESYKNIKEAFLAFDAGDANSAFTFMQTASSQVPESPDLKTMTSYFNGLVLLNNNKSAEALTEFKKCVGLLPPDFAVDFLIIQSKMGKGFDEKDYNLFLSAAKEYWSFDDSNPLAWASVASAYACIYASENADSIKSFAFYYLKQAKDIDDTSEYMQEYYNRIEHRIYTKNIISKEEFDSIYPHGWSITKN